MISAPSDLAMPQGDTAPAGDTQHEAAGNSGNNASAPAPAQQTPPPGEAAPGQKPPQEDPFALRLREHEASQRQHWQQQLGQWRKEVTEDPQLGGANLPATVARAQLALDRFDEGKRIGQLLEQTGYGNNPDVLRFFNRLADALMEDGLVQGQAGGGMPPLEERMYAGWSSRNGRA